MLKALNFVPKTCSFFTLSLLIGQMYLYRLTTKITKVKICIPIYADKCKFFVEYCEINTTGLLILTRPRRASTSAWRTDRSHPFYPGLQASPTGLRLRMGLTSDLTPGTALCLCTTMTRAATRVRKSAFAPLVLWPSISR